MPTSVPNYMQNLTFFTENALSSNRFVNLCFPCCLVGGSFVVHERNS